MKRTTAIILMAAASIGFMAPALFTGRTAGATDLLLTHAPYRESLATAPHVGNPLQSDLTQQMSFLAEFWSAAKERNLQLWEPDVGGGVPLFTAMYNQLLPPWFLVFAFVPLALGTTIGLTLALFVGQLGMYGLCRRLGLGIPAATFAAIAYVFSGPVTSSLMRIHSALLLPVLLFAIHGAITEPSRRRRYLALAALVTTFIWSSGFPFAGVAIVYVGIGWALYLSLAESRGRTPIGRRLIAIVRAGLPTGAALVAGTLIASVQLLPSLEFLRETGFLDRTFSGHIDLALLGSAFSGRFFGARQDGDWWWPVAGQSNPFEASITTGLVAIALLLVMVATRRARVGRAADSAVASFLLPAGLVAFAATYLGGVALAATHVLPFTSNNQIGRARFVFSLAVAIAAAIGLDDLLDRDRDGRQRSLILRLELLGILVIFGIGGFFGLRKAVSLDRITSVLVDLAVPTGALAVAALAIAVARRRRNLAALLTVAAVATELQWGAWGFLPASPREAFYPKSPSFAAMASDIGPGGSYRFLARNRRTPRPDVAAFLDLKDARTAFPRMSRYEDFWKAVDPNVFRVDRYIPTFNDLQPSSRALDALSVRYLTEPLFGDALEIEKAMTIMVDKRRPLPTTQRIIVPTRGIRSLVIPLAAERRDCLTGWVEIRAEGTTSRRLLREVDGANARFTLPDIGTPGEAIVVELAATHCPVALDAGRISVRTRISNSVLTIKSIDGWVVYERASAIPRATLAEATVEPEDGAARIRHILERNSSGVVTVEGGFGPRTFRGGEAELVVDDPNRVVARADSRGPGLLVLRDVDAPGWKARVDGRDAPIISTDHAFRGVAVPDGTSLVEFRYDPDSYRAGRLLAVLGVLLILALALGSRVAGSMTRRRPAATVDAGPEPRTDDDDDR